MGLWVCRLLILNSIVEMWALRETPLQVLRYEARYTPEGFYDTILLSWFLLFDSSVRPVGFLACRGGEHVTFAMFRDTKDGFL